MLTDSHTYTGSSIKYYARYLLYYWLMGIGRPSLNKSETRTGRQCGTETDSTLGLSGEETGGF